MSKINLKESVRDALLEYRGETITQKMVADASDISERYCSKLENAKSNPSFAIMAKLRKSCGIDLNKIVDRTDMK